ncbi:MAG: 1-acyl-sn-glycerol-3-phosphate acyltransferase [Acidobacteriota bacterium]
MPSDGPADRSAESTPAPTTGQRAWRTLCRVLARTFYRRVEVTGTERLSLDGPVILCANHVNALADAVVAQAAVPRPIHPIARSGLFRNPLLRPILRLIQAVPVHRRHPGRDTREQNRKTFERCFEYLEQGRVLLIFPEGQSHSDPSLRPLKTGAARLALGHLERTGEVPVVMPLGLTFTHKGRFRAHVLAQVGEPIPVTPVLDSVPIDSEDATDEELRTAEEARVQQLTDSILRGLQGVTLNVDSWEDLALLKLMQQFFALRAGRGERLSLERRFRSFRRLLEAHRALRAAWPERVEALRSKLRRFEALCRRYGVRDYQLELRYTPGVVARFTARTLLFLLFVVPPALWGLVNSLLPYLATREVSRRAARARDQYDTAGMLFGLAFFGGFWGAQTFAVFWLWGSLPAGLYALSLPITGLVALEVSRERQRIQEEVRVFLLFVRRRELRAYLRARRKELEEELARMARLAKRAKDRLTA